MLVIKLWQFMPHNPENLPAEWPAEVVDVPDDTVVLPPEYDNGQWLLMSLAEFNAYKASVQHLYDAWLAAKQAAEELERQAEEVRQQAIARVQRGRDIIAELEAEMVRVGLDDDMKAKLVGGIHDVLILLTAGQLAKAKQVVLNLQPSGDLTQNMINKLQAFMNREIA